VLIGVLENFPRKRTNPANGICGLNGENGGFVTYARQRRFNDGKLSDALVLLRLQRLDMVLTINWRYPMTTMHNPLHPGEIVRDALFEGTTLTVTDAANRLQISRSTLSRLLNGHAGISADMAYRLSMLLNTSPEMWMNIQKDYDLWEARPRMAKITIVRYQPEKKRKQAS